MHFTPKNKTQHMFQKEINIGSNEEYVKKRDTQGARKKLVTTLENYSKQIFINILE